MRRSGAKGISKDHKTYFPDLEDVAYDNSSECIGVTEWSGYPSYSRYTVACEWSVVAATGTHAPKAQIEVYRPVRLTHIAMKCDQYWFKDKYGHSGYMSCEYSRDGTTWHTFPEQVYAFSFWVDSDANPSDYFWMYYMMPNHNIVAKYWRFFEPVKADWSSRYADGVWHIDRVKAGAFEDISGPLARTVHYRGYLGDTAPYVSGSYPPETDRSMPVYTAGHGLGTDAELCLVTEQPFDGNWWLWLDPAIVAYNRADEIYNDYARYIRFFAAITPTGFVTHAGGYDETRTIEKGYDSFTGYTESPRGYQYHATWFRSNKSKGVAVVSFVDDAETPYALNKEYTHNLGTDEVVGLYLENGGWGGIILNDTLYPTVSSDLYTLEVTENTINFKGYDRSTLDKNGGMLLFDVNSSHVMSGSFTTDGSNEIVPLADKGVPLIVLMRPDNSKYEKWATLDGSNNTSDNLVCEFGQFTFYNTSTGTTWVWIAVFA